MALIAITAGGELKIEGLKRGFAKIMGILSGQTIMIFIMVPLFFVCISGAVPGLGLDAFSDFGLAGSIAVGAVLAAISLATSPAATIAIINETNAKGEVTETTLATVVLKDVVVVILFSITAAISVSLLGADGAGQSDLAQTLIWHILGSLIIGAGIGLAMGLYLSWVRHEVLLFIVVLFLLRLRSRAVAPRSRPTLHCRRICSVKLLKRGRYSNPRSRAAFHAGLCGLLYPRRREITSRHPRTNGPIRDCYRACSNYCIVHRRQRRSRHRCEQALRRYGWMGFISQPAWP